MKLLTRYLRKMFAMVALLSAVLGQEVQAQYTPIYYDGFGVSASSSNVNAELGNPRQGGPLLPISNVSNTDSVDAGDDYHHQLFSAAASPSQPLLLASDLYPTLRTFSNGSVPIYVYPTMVSPNYNFKGTSGAAILGKRITFDLDLGTGFTPAGPGFAYLSAGFTIGATHTLVDAEDSRSYSIAQDATNPECPGPCDGIPAWQPSSNYFGLRFIEDVTPTATESFVQSFDGLDPVNFRSPHSGGTGPLSVQIDVDDLEDGNPWDGVGSTTIVLSINGELINLSGSPDEPVYSFTKGDGGYTDNFITMWGFANTYNFQLTTHTFDNLTVYSYAEPTIVPGDYNENGTVDAADYTKWCDNLNASVTLPGENPTAVTPGVVDQEDYDFWKANFGASGGGTGGLVAGAVPEPAAWILLSVGLCGSVICRRNRC